MKWRDPNEARRRLFEAAMAQDGYFTASQALMAGYSWRLQHYHANRGHWHRIDRGMFRLVEYPPSRFEDLVRWTLWSRGKAVVSHDSAAAVHEIGDLLPSRVHLTVSPNFRKVIPAGVVLYKARLPETDVQAGPGYRITTPLRTIVDLLKTPIESDWLTGVMRDALNRGAVQRHALEVAIAGLDEQYRDRGRRLMAAAEKRLRAV
jgi:predicted transcriptional regulator of viral defense system